MFGWLKKLTGGARKSTAPPVLHGPLSEDVLRTALARPCAPLIFHRPANIDPFSTMFGTVRLARKDEVWPTYEGAPMWPLCQINLAQAPLRPEALSDLSLLTLFIAPEHAITPTPIINTRKPDPAATWALRSYATLGGLTIPTAPEHGSPLSPRLGEWGDVRADFANHDMAGHVVDTNANDVYAYEWAQTVQQTKLGGWPATVQSEPWWAYQKTRDTWDYVIQIENEPKAGWQGWGDGAAYIARSRKRPHLWAIDVQFT
ncbi:DUF1963 domain-containing protein [Sulfitobacter sp. F26169L]|uniref:DUF1963 domain-containing protein n=1 Tax=Sulfitobacter sp. F26169L TaxID=2996015 RepID=UPI002260E65A|nr:DUF1963 domain-containing protein [Sulfitobacter sp. F26169L]MCX7567217.1 DUF1963 domain-containing protein [Sulfitobacter sp. F26169L]